MNERKRKLIKGLGMGAVWTSPVVSAIALPAHAMTSAGRTCSAFETESIEQPISITVTDDDVRGPLIATRNGQTFQGVLENTAGLCADGITPLVSVIEFSGTIDAVRGTVSGVFDTRQFCGTELACEQIATFTAMQTSMGRISDVGDYEGRVTGTLRCCVDLI